MEAALRFPLIVFTVGARIVWGGATVFTAAAVAMIVAASGGGGGGGGAISCTTTLSAGANVASAISSATAGDTICLNDGTYGAINLPTTTKSPRVTVVSKNLHGANVAGLNVVGSATPNGINIDGLNMTATGEFDEGNHATNVTVQNVEFNEFQLAIFTNAYNNQNVTVGPGNHFGPFEDTNLGQEGRLSVVYSGGPGTNPSGVTVIGNTFGPGGCSDGLQLGSNAVQVTENYFNGITQSYAGIGDCVNQPAGTHVDATQGFGDKNTHMWKNHWGPDLDVAWGWFDGVDSAIIEDNVCEPQVGLKKCSLRGATNTIVRHNTFHNANFEIAGKTGDPSNVTIQNNIFQNWGWLNGDATCTSCTFSNNMFDSSNGTFGTSNTSGTPTFIGGTNPGSFSGFKLTAGSAGHNAASDGLDMGVRYESLANVWVTTTGGSCTRSADKQSLNAATSCADFDQAAAVAQPGDLVLIRAGTYGSFDGTNKAVTFRADLGQTVNWWAFFRSGDCCFTMDGGPNLDMVVNGNGGPSFGAGTHDITIKNNEFIESISIDGAGPNANLVFDHNWHHDVGAFGNPPGSLTFAYNDPHCDCTIKNSLFENFPADGVQTGTPLLVENNIFNNITPETDQHTDQIQGVFANNVTARGNLVTGDCEQGITSFDGGANLTFEHNVIAGCTAHWLSVGNHAAENPTTNPTISWNTVDTGVAPGSVISCEHGQGATFNNNIVNDFSLLDCSTGLTHINNMLLGTPVAPDFTGTAVFVGGSGRKKFRDYCLTPASPGYTGASNGGQVGACGNGFTGGPPDDWYTFSRSTLGS